MVAIGVIHTVALVFAVLCSSGGAAVAGLPVFACCALFVFALQWLAFVPAYARQTERYYDLTGSVTYIGAVVLALVLVDEISTRSLLLAGLVSLWALRLGSFLFRRIGDDGGDRRFSRIGRGGRSPKTQGTGPSPGADPRGLQNKRTIRTISGALVSDAPV